MSDPFLVLSNIEAGYGKKQVLFDVSLTLDKGEIVSLIGHNGAGKTTLLRTIFGHLGPSRGTVVMDGATINNWTMPERVQHHLMYIPQEQFVFGDLSVQENLALAGYPLQSHQDYERRLTECFEFLPILKERGNQKAGTLSGGQQRILTLGMIMIAQPKMLLLDEPSLGLAPSLVDQAMDLMQDMAKRFGMTVLLVEQNVKKAFAVADTVHVLRAGRLIAQRPGGELPPDDNLWDLF
ncbi:ABC transporter ATP-binding protein [Castellaniella denitrificans]|uniref:ABC transporter ATP-binding protein n=1 Tax=Castellaniella denitrificans TaxID=56119 RepID=UPI001AC9250F|nr:ABC transporter ATP-binding protein [Burkholderiales bacterium]